MLLRAWPGARLWLACIILLAGALSLASPAGAATAQPSFATPEAAVAALIKAVKAEDRKTAFAVLGPGSERWTSSGDAVADRAARVRFVEMFDERHAIVPEGDDRATLAIGPDDWPFAFPLVKTKAGWRFDTEAGRNELLARRIGQNELSAINVMLAIVDAQREYASLIRDSSGLPAYARKFASTAGRKDGLYWPTTANEPPSPLGNLVTQAAGEGYAKGTTPRPYHGYRFRLLTAQGPHAAGGAHEYIVRGRMIGGFAAIATPAEYGNSGVMTFIVNHDGIVYEKDLGPQTEQSARGITRFDPGPGWTAVKPR